MTNGLVLGKFMPPHKGHVFLCDFARRQCDRLTILVCSLPDDPIPGDLRYQWMKALFPDCAVVWCNEVVQQEPAGENDTAFWDTWRDLIRRYALAGDSIFDLVFASEAYGLRLARELGARFVPCDIARVIVPVSGTACRADPATQWSFLPDVVKPYFRRRICLFGPESSGKTTLATQLAVHYRTVCVPEYGRAYTETFGTVLEPADLVAIAAGHRAAVAAAEPLAGPLLIEDTDPLLTLLWGDMLFGVRDPALNALPDPADLYLLCDVDFPWVDDGTRYFPQVADRQRFFTLCRAELEARNLPYLTLSGPPDARLQQAIAAIDTAFRHLAS